MASKITGEIGWRKWLEKMAGESAWRRKPSKAEADPQKRGRQ